MKQLILNFYRFIFARAVFYKFNQHLFTLVLRGIGVLNSEGPSVTGEKYFLEKIISKLNIKTVVDIGANTGGYCLMIKNRFPSAVIYACEPHPQTFKKLKRNIKGKGIYAVNLGFSEKRGRGKLWDFSDDAELKRK